MESGRRDGKPIEERKTDKSLPAPESAVRLAGQALESVGGLVGAGMGAGGTEGFFEQLGPRQGALGSL
jgi:hypothetical protein